MFEEEQDRNTGIDGLQVEEKERGAAAEAAGLNERKGGEVLELRRREAEAAAIVGGR